MKLTLPLLFALGTALTAAPNVIVFLSDDQGWGDLRSSGNLDLQTPHIDSLAAQGASFDRFYVCPVCSPTRAEFLTGRHHARSGVYSTSAGGERMDLDETTIACFFKEAGYTTGAFGKWHNGMQFPYHPNGRGFDEYYGFCSGHWGHYYDWMLEHNGRIVKGEGFCIDDFTNKAMAFMEKSAKKKKPFFAYIPYNTPHSPMQVPDKFWNKFAKRPLKFSNQQKKEKPAQDSHKRCALAMCENLDWNVGRVLEKLDQLDVADNTIIAWFHDNGPNGNRWNGDMKGRKGSTDEGGVRSPLYVRWPASIKPGTKIPHISSARDLLPTLCELAGVPAKADKPLDGKSLAPLILGKAVDWPERTLINHWKDRISVRTQRFRLDNKGALYDMLADPGQRKPVTEKHPDVAKKLAAIADAHRKEFMPTYNQDDRPFVIAHPGAPLTQLPARDAIASGGIERSNKFPNCSYFRNWKSTEGRVTFKAEVAKSGTFKAVLYYTAKDPGAKCELRFNDAVLPFEIRGAHNPPEVGAAQDHYPRGESYVKDFKPLDIGEIKLGEGAGELSIRALEFPGEEAMEFRLLTLERVE